MLNVGSPVLSGSSWIDKSIPETVLLKTPVGNINIIQRILAIKDQDRLGLKLINHGWWMVIYGPYGLKNYPSLSSAIIVIHEMGIPFLTNQSLTEGCPHQD